MPTNAKHATQDDNSASVRISPDQFQMRLNDDPLVRQRTLNARNKEAAPALDPYQDAARHILIARATERGEPITDPMPMVDALAKSLSESPLTPDHQWPDLFEAVMAADANQPTWRIKALPADLTATEAPRTPSNTGNVWLVRPDGKVNPEDSRDFLNDITPVGRPKDVAKVKAAVIDLILGTGTTFAESQRRLMTIGTSFATWCLVNSADGKFVPDRDFNEDMIHDYLVHGLYGVAENTRSTYRSELRRLGGNQPPSRSLGRKRAQQPYLAGVARLLWVSALELDDWVAVEMRTLLALTLGAGARAAEVHQMRADQVENRGTRLVVQVARDAVVRDVPVYGEQAQWLRERSKALAGDSFLFRPGYTNRRNAISDLVTKATARSDVFEDFKAVRARHTWICHYLAAGMKFSALCQAADVGEDSNLFTDLSPYLPPMTAADVRREFDRIHSSTQTATHTHTF